MKKVLFAMIIGSLMMTSCLSEKRANLIGTWTNTCQMSDSDGSCDMDYSNSMNTTFKDNANYYEHGVCSFKYKVSDVDCITVVEFVYDLNSSGSWSLDNDEITVKRGKVNYELQTTKFNLYDTETGEEIVPNPEYKDSVIKDLKKSLNEGLEDDKKELLEPGVFTIVSINDTEMHLEDRDGVSVYKKVN